MKKILMITLLALTTTMSHSQIVLDKPVKKSLIQGDTRLRSQMTAAKYTGAVVGYALACKFDEAKITIVQDDFKKKVGKLNLIPDKQLTLWKEYETVATEKRKLEFSKTECNLFQDEFNKIISSIKGTP